MLQSVELARLVFKRFGYDVAAATSAWRRLLENAATISDFMELVEYPEHTASCEGYCRSHNDMN